MSSKKRYNPAGIFSTDDPQADARQIMAEQYDHDLEYYDPNDPYADYEPEEIDFEDDTHTISRLTSFVCDCSCCGHIGYISQADPEALVNRFLDWLYDHGTRTCGGKLIIAEF